MTTTPPEFAGRVFHTRIGTNWHAAPQCPALDTARLNEGGQILAVLPDRVGDRRPCLVCATPPANEWTLTRENLVELLELIEPSKAHWGSITPPPDAPYAATVGIDGLTIRAHKGRPQSVARFGDTIRRERGGRYTVHPAAACSNCEGIDPASCLVCRGATAYVRHNTALEG